MTDGLGYNVKKAEALMTEVGNCYEALGKEIAASWPTVSSTLRENWIGEDELHYEETVVKRINDMYINAYGLADTAIHSIEALARGWWAFQKANVFQGESELALGELSIEIPTITKNESVLSFTKIEIGLDVNRGLKNMGSAETIKGEIDQFVKRLKSKMAELVEMDVQSAFFGDQTQKIKDYLILVNNSMANVTVAIKDLYVALDQMASSLYVKRGEQSAEFVDSEGSKVTTAIEENTDASTRWSD